MLVGFEDRNSVFVGVQFSPVALEYADWFLCPRELHGQESLFDSVTTTPVALEYR